MPPSAAWTSARNRITTAPNIHETSAAGPATFDAVRAPSSQPEPMIEPTDANVSATRPTLRCSFRSDSPVTPSLLSIATVRPSLFAPLRIGCAGTRVVAPRPPEVDCRNQPEAVKRRPQPETGAAPAGGTRWSSYLSRCSTKPRFVLHPIQNEHVPRLRARGGGNSRG